jgi:predicted 3-demethylubiquinone-9 3-methyltransferase (glyoxalase superfamily)
MAQGSVFLWFSENAQEAAAHYRKVFPDAVSTGEDNDLAEGHEGFMSAQLEIGGLRLIVFNGGPYGSFKFNESTSIFLTCQDQAEVDRVWSGLTEGGEPGQCGWLKDRYGLSWQVVPKLFNELMASDDATRRTAVFEAMMKMTKFDCAALQAAYDG